MEPEWIGLGFPNQRAEGSVRLFWHADSLLSVVLFLSSHIYSYSFIEYLVSGNTIALDWLMFTFALVSAFWFRVIGPSTCWRLEISVISQIFFPSIRCATLLELDQPRSLTSPQCRECMSEQERGKETEQHVYFAGNTRRLWNWYFWLGLYGHKKSWTGSSKSYQKPIGCNEKKRYIIIATMRLCKFALHDSCEW